MTKYYDFICQECGADVEWAYEPDFCPDCVYNANMKKIAARAAKREEMVENLNRELAIPCEECGAPRKLSYWDGVVPMMQYTCSCWRNTEGSRHTWGYE